MLSFYRRDRSRDSVYCCAVPPLRGAGRVVPARVCVGRHLELVVATAAVVPQRRQLDAKVHAIHR